MYLVMPKQQKFVWNLKLKSLPITTQNDLVDRGGFTKQRNLGKGTYLTFRSKFSKPYERNTLKL